MIKVERIQKLGNKYGIPKNIWDLMLKYNKGREPYRVIVWQKEHRLYPGGLYECRYFDNYVVRNISIVELQRSYNIYVEARYNIRGTVREFKNRFEEIK